MKIDYTKKLADIETSIADVRVKLSKLDAKRDELALPYAEGDAKARKAIERLAADEIALHGEIKLLGSAHSQLREKKAASDRKDAEAAWAKKCGEAQATADKLRALDVEIDADMCRVAEKLRARRDLISQLKLTRILPVEHTNRLQDKQAPSAAAHAAGLNEFMSMDFVSAGHRIPLGERYGAILKSVRRPMPATLTVVERAEPPKPTPVEVPTGGRPGETLLEALPRLHAEARREMAKRGST